jgi:hypothetical protein
VDTEKSILTTVESIIGFVGINKKASDEPKIIKTSKE